MEHILGDIYTADEINEIALDFYNIYDVLTDQYPNTSFNSLDIRT